MLSRGSDKVTGRSTLFTADPVSFSLATGLIVASIIAWALSYFTMSPGMLLYSLDFNVLTFFLLVWIVGMVAMMFPSMIPVVSMYNRMTRTLTSKLARIVRTPIFLSGYLTLYLVLGLTAYLAVLFTHQLATIIPSLLNYAMPAVGVVLIVAGVWQLTPLKEVCLRNCTSPLEFFLTHSRSGPVGAFRMGAEHGYFCVGCCYLYMIVMLAVAGMSIPSMALLAIAITLEKAVLGGAKWFTRFIAAGFIILGIVVWFFPGALGLAQ